MLQSNCSELVIVCNYNILEIFFRLMACGQTSNRAKLQRSGLNYGASVIDHAMLDLLESELEGKTQKLYIKVYKL